MWARRRLQSAIRSHHEWWPGLLVSQVLHALHTPVIYLPRLSRACAAARHGQVAAGESRRMNISAAVYRTAGLRRFDDWAVRSAGLPGLWLFAASRGSRCRRSTIPISVQEPTRRESETMVRR